MIPVRISGYRIRIASIARAAAPLVVIALATAVLLLFPPAQFGFYPECPIRQYLHLQCPGCGGTRALAALLHGHLVEALHLNALITLLLPFAAPYGIRCYSLFLQRNPLRWPQASPLAMHAAAALTAVFTVVRNLPLHSF
jgi:hypothetical protein